MQAFLRVVRDIALLIARIVVGVVLVAHGWNRWQGTGLAHQAEVLTEAGLPAPDGLAVATVIFEIVGGTLLVFGLATPLIGLGMAVMNVAIILTTRAENGFFVTDGGWEYNAVLAGIGLLLLAYGSGRLGLDHLFLRPVTDGEPLIDEEPRNTGDR